MFMDPGNREKIALNIYFKEEIKIILEFPEM